MPYKNAAGVTMYTSEERKVPCEVYSRIVGYLRPVQNWNKGKRQEFKERAAYRVEKERIESDEGFKVKHHAPSD